MKVTLPLVCATAIALGCQPRHFAQRDASDRDSNVAIDAATIDSSDSGAVQRCVDSTDGSRSGSRLKLRWFETADGTCDWGSRTFHDAQRDEDCYITQWIDGSGYCVPTSAGGAYYADAACSEPVMLSPQDPCSATPPPYMLTFQPSQCDMGAALGTHVYARGAKTTASPLWSLSWDGQCSQTSYFGDVDYYAAGPEITAQLVQLTLSSPAGSSRLLQRYYQSSDGFQFPASVYDETLGLECRVAEYSPSGADCEPVDAVATLEEFQDARCTLPAYVTDSCPAPQTIRFLPMTSCPNNPPSFATAGGTISSYYFGV